MDQVGHNCRLRVCVLASDLMGSPGGATSVTAWMAEALMNCHSVTLAATGKEIDLAELNRLYGTHLDPSKVTVRQWPSRPNRQVLRLPRARLLRLATLVRGLGKHPHEYDLYVSATNEVKLPRPHLQYIHYPQHHLSAMRLQFSGLSLVLRAVNELLYRVVSGFRKNDLSTSCVLTNSRWVRNLLATLYGVDAEVVYPPVCVPETRTVPFKRREFAFVTVGRFKPQKRLHDAIHIVDRLREQFPDLKLHIVGFGQGRYRDFICRLVASRSSYVRIHENVSREWLVELMSGCQFGIHSTPDEQFGMAAAELAACGCLVFVHNSGGQVEIVDNDSELLFSDVEECCRKITHQIENVEAAEEKTRRYSQMARVRFGSERFMVEVRDAVRRMVDRAEVGSSSPNRRQASWIGPDATSNVSSPEVRPGNIVRMYDS